MSSDGPLAPFDDWPVQLYVERLGHVWYTAPATFVNQVEVMRATPEGVGRLMDVIDHVIEREREDIRAHGGLLIFHDWRQVAGYESEARRVFLDRMRRREPGYLRRAVAIVRDSPLVKMAVQTANLVMALRAGGQLEMGTDPVPALLKHGIQPPAETGWR